jgi:hypothetical protein
VICSWQIKFQLHNLAFRNDVTEKGCHSVNWPNQLNLVPLSPELSELTHSALNDYFSSVNWMEKMRNRQVAIATMLCDVRFDNSFSHCKVCLLVYCRSSLAVNTLDNRY